MIKRFRRGGGQPVTQSQTYLKRQNSLFSMIGRIKSQAVEKGGPPVDQTFQFFDAVLCWLKACCVVKAQHVFSQAHRTSQAYVPHKPLCT